MLDIGWSEMLVIACLAIVVIGPKQLPGALRAVGYWLGKARRLAREFQGHVDDMIRESEMDEVKKEVNSIANYDIQQELKNNYDQSGTSDGSFDHNVSEEAEAVEADDKTMTTGLTDMTPSTEEAAELDTDGATDTVTPTPVEPAIDHEPDASDEELELMRREKAEAGAP